MRPTYHLEVRVAVVIAASLLVSAACASSGLAANGPRTWASTASPARITSAPASVTRTPSAVRYHLKSFVVPRTARRNTWFNCRVSVTPRYTGYSRVVTFYLQGWTGSRWKTVNHKAVHGSSSGNRTVFRVKIRLSRASWRIRAKFHKSGSPTVWTHYKRVRVS